MIGYVRAAGWTAFVAAVLLLPIPARSAPRLALAIHAGYNEYDMTDVNQDLITHSINEAVFLAQRAVVLSRRPARVLLDHPIDLPEQRAEELRTTAAFAREAHALHVALRGEEP